MISNKQLAGSFTEKAKREFPRFLSLPKEKKVEYLDFESPFTGNLLD